MSGERPRYRPWWVDRGVYGVLVGDEVVMWRVGYTGVPTDVTRVATGGRRGLSLILSLEGSAEQMLSKDTTRRVVGGEAAAVADEEWATLYPMLTAHLTQAKWPDGSGRQLSTLSLFADGGVVKCVLKDRDAGLCLWAACPTFSGLFGVLEALLCDPGAEWRVDRQAPGQKASRVKR